MALALLLAASPLPLASCANDGPPQTSKVQRQLLKAPRAALARGETEKALARYEQLALNGVVQAQYRLGKVYEDGRGVPQDRKEARRWYKMAADRGDPRAQRELGLMLARGRGGPQELEEGLALLAKAGVHDEMARHMHAKLTLQNQDELESGTAEAVEELTSMARDGYLQAQLDLARLYEEGLVVRRDPVEADRWYSIAGLQVAGPAERGDPKALDRMASLLAFGRGVPQDVERALELWEQAGKAGRTQAYRRAAKFLDEGHEQQPADPETALVWFVKGAEAGESGAAYEAGKRFFKGEGTERDPIRAKTMLELAIANGERRAHAWLGDLEAEEGSALYDIEAAAENYRLAGVGGDGKGLHRLARLHERGGLPEGTDPALALAYYRLAASLGYDRGRDDAARLEAELSAEQLRQAEAFEVSWLGQGRSA